MKDLINETTPLNIAEEREKFFASDSYNPQLKYGQPIVPTDLSIWGMPKEKFFQHALKMLQHPQAAYVPDSEYVTEEFVQQTVTEFNKYHQLVPPIKVVFSRDLVSRCKVSGNTIYFKQPIRYTKAKFSDLCRHELESHMLRRINQEQEPWADLEVPEIEVRKTEEGIANLHTHLLRENKLLSKSYLTYSAVYLAQMGSFRQVYDKMLSYGISSVTAWQLALRTKRGLSDTSRPGGLTKDICYLEGSVEVWDWVINHQNDPHDLYLGRLSLALIPEYKPRSELANLRYPTFFKDMTSYQHNIKLIGDVNDFIALT